MSTRNSPGGKPRSLSEKLLLSLSRKPGSEDYEAGRDHWTTANALVRLCHTFPNFMETIQRRDVLDYGCGPGYQAVALAREGARYVAGIDTNAATLQRAIDLARTLGMDSEVEFSDRLEDRWKGGFDLVISQDSMEHFPEPAVALESMKSALRKDGIIVIVFGCPWFSPYGSHMHFFTKIPWVNILFDETTVMAVRRRFRNDGATRYHEVESGLNKMTIAKYERTIALAGLRVLYRRYRCVKGLDFLGKAPVVRELFINDVGSILAPRGTASTQSSFAGEAGSFHPPVRGV
jgi:SAM-dependent methyltransferase